MNIIITRAVISNGTIHETIYPEPEVITIEQLEQKRKEQTKAIRIGHDENEYHKPTVSYCWSQSGSAPFDF